MYKNDIDKCIESLSIGALHWVSIQLKAAWVKYNNRVREIHKEEADSRKVRNGNHRNHIFTLVRNQHIIPVFAKNSQWFAGIKALTGASKNNLDAPSTWNAIATAFSDEEFEYIKSDMLKARRNNDVFQKSLIKLAVSHAYMTHEAGFLGTAFYDGQELKGHTESVFEHYIKCIKVFSRLPKWAKSMRVDHIVREMFPHNSCRLLYRLDRIDKGVKEFHGWNIGESVTERRWNAMALSRRARHIELNWSKENPSAQVSVSACTKMCGMSRESILSILSVAKRNGMGITATSTRASSELEQYIIDGHSMYETVRRALESCNRAKEIDTLMERSHIKKIVPTMSVKEMVEASGMNHRNIPPILGAIEQESRRNKLLKYLEAGTMTVEGEILPVIKLPDKLEELRLRSPADFVVAGEECGHCLGNYSMNRDVLLGLTIGLRKDSTCAMVSLLNGRVLQCYDRRNTRTKSSKAFEVFIRGFLPVIRNKVSNIPKERLSYLRSIENRYSTF